jgi:hypothetical protein
VASALAVTIILILYCRIYIIKNLAASSVLTSKKHSEFSYGNTDTATATTRPAKYLPDIFKTPTPLIRRGAQHSLAKRTGE